MPIFQSIRQDKTWYTGIILIIASLIFFCRPTLIGPGIHDGLGLYDAFGHFLLNYLFTVAYFFVLLGSGRLKKDRRGLAPFFLFLVLSLISAYALNREIPVFEKSTGWLVFVLVLSCLNCMTLQFFAQMPAWAQHIVCLIAGVSIMLFLYLMIYLFPICALSIIVFWFLGISLHTFVPLLFFIYTIVFISRAGAGNKRLFVSFISGIALVLLITTSYIGWWSSIVGDMNDEYARGSNSQNRGIPAWTYTAQHCPQSILTEKVLKAGLVYSIYNPQWSAFDGRNMRNFGEERKHDPLIILSTLIAGEPNLSEGDRMKVLECLYDSRHQAEARLWKGDDLQTEKVNTTVQLWPGLHLAYTEKNITVTNKAIHPYWPDQQEAIYTFHLPEGGVVSSLSLMINGKEQKGVLTTREKADSAYRTIVGQEWRDPSVVHWQEGNTVSVRVFPVVSGESRQFTIGITAPLEKKEKELIYHNIYFDGPSVSDTREDLIIRSESPLQKPVFPSFFPSGNEKGIRRSGKYQADWMLQFQDAGIDRQVYVFDGKQYSVLPYQMETEPVDLRKIYLDINKSWTKKEYDQVLQLLPDKQVFVYCNEYNSAFGTGLVTVNRNNKDALFAALSRNRFSLFPVFAITDNARSLLISKSPPSSPAIADLDDSPFKQKLQDYFARGKKIKLFCLDNELSPYLRALKEFRAFQYEQGGMEQLKELLTREQFVREAENDRQVVIDRAGLVIQRTDLPGDEANADSGGRKHEPIVAADVPVALAPDHVLRLYAYNDILRQVEALSGNDPVKDPSKEDRLIGEAKQANIVTPLSSLVVLETKEDYDRFNIQDSKNSLRNASLHAKGAAPEPGEWALVIIVALALLYAKYRPSSAKSK